MEDKAENPGRRLEPACARFSEDLSSYLEGEERPELLSHAAACDFCQCLLADVQLIRSASAGLMQEDPPPRVWANVRLALVEEGVIHSGLGLWRGQPFRFLRRPAPLAAAAAVVVAIVLLKVPGVIVHPRVEPPNIIHAAAFGQSYMRPQDLASLKQTIRQLEGAYSANSALLEPSLKTTYEKSLASLDDEIHECQLSMKEEPEDGLAREYLSRAYVQKAQLLQSALDYNLR